jgi:hypothetical protein
MKLLEKKREITIPAGWAPSGIFPKGKPLGALKKLGPKKKIRGLELDRKVLSYYCSCNQDKNNTKWSVYRRVLIIVSFVSIVRLFIRSWIASLIIWSWRVFSTIRSWRGFSIIRSWIGLPIIGWIVQTFIGR